VTASEVGVPEVVSKDDLNDRTIIRIFPFLVVACILGGVVLSASVYSSTIGEILIGFCIAFVFGFFFLGILAMFLKRKGVVRSRAPLVFFGIGPLIVALTGYLIGIYLSGMDTFESLIFRNTGDVAMDLLWISAQIYVIMAGSVVAAYGVICVVSSYFRQYIASVYKYMERLKNDGTDDRGGRMTLRVFDVPDVIDIDRVELEPIYRNPPFPRDAFISMAVSIFLLDLVICSYFFLNPILLDEMNIYETIIVGMLISFFIPVLIMPWYITKENGAKIIGPARPFYLWKGLKKRMYQSFFAFVMIFVLVLLMLHFGNDLLRITYTYIGYVAFAAALAVIYSYIFFNNYNEHIKEGIIKKFNE